MEEDKEQLGSQETWDIIRKVVENGDSKALVAYLEKLGPREIARALSRLDEQERTQLLLLLTPDEAADLMEELPEAQAVDLLQDQTAEQAAAIVDRLSSDHQADILQALPASEAETILHEMDPREAKDARQLLSYPADTAGGIMVTEYISFPETWLADDLLVELRKNAEQYTNYDILYAYVTTDEGRLKGVVKLRDLVFCSPDAPLGSLMIQNPVQCLVDSSLDELEAIFDRHEFFGVPVTDRRERLVGLVRRADLNEALEKRADGTFLKASGILGGEELRSMPVKLRSVRRLSILTISIGLNMFSASIIAAYQDTLQAYIVLAVFLPMISDLSGCSGNQAIAVSIRELAMGLVKPHELMLVLLKEIKVGIINGISLGITLGVVAFLWKGNPYLAIVIAISLSLNVIFAVVMGGLLPLLLKRFKIDPAIASSPALTTMTDSFGFFLVLSLATSFMPWLQKL